MPYFHESCYCPECQAYGQFEFEYGRYKCKACGDTIESSTLLHWNKAFQAGREFERQEQLKQSSLPISSP